jgi:hypothetical protein
MTNLIWNYDDVDNNLLCLYTGKVCLGYFRIDTGMFVVIPTHSETIKLNITILRKIVNEYDDAIKEAKKLIEVE